MFSGASNFAADVDKTFLIIISVALFFLIGISLTILSFIIKYNRKRHPKAEQVKDNVALEISWTIGAIVLVLVLFYFGYTAFLPERKIPKDAMPVKVISRMWNWSFDYGGGKIVPDTLVVPINKAIRLDMVSLDVTHSLFIPAFRIKEDVVPGMTTQMWFIAERLGTYEILCAEFCGLRHSYMQGHVRVVPEAEYNTWLASVKEVKEGSEHPGYTVIKQQGCLACHSLDGTKLIGPSFKNIYNSRYVVISEGEEHTITADSSYIKNAIYNPDENIVKGYKKGLMKSYAPVIADAQLSEIVSYLKTISDN